MVCKVNKEIRCILGLSIAFMFLFAANFTTANMQKTVVNSIADERNKNGTISYNVDGYTVSGLVYTVFAVALWFGPYVNYALGPRLTMFFSAVGYMCYVISYIIEDQWAIYLGAIITGIAAGTLWPAQGHYMIENSSPQTTARNVGIFMFIYMASNMIGNIFVFISFYGLEYINQKTRRTTLYTLLAINVVALGAFLVLPKSINEHKVKDYGPIKTMRKSLIIQTSPRMLWLTLSFFYAGLQQSFWDGIYSPSIGFTTAFGNSSKELVALSGIFMSIGALLGAFCPIVFSGWIRRHHFARRMIFLIGIIAQLFTYAIVFINLPDSAVFGNTSDTSVVDPPSPVLAMVGSVLISFGDSCLTTQIYSFIGDFYRESSAEACALYKFMKGVFVAVSFYTSSYLGLHTQVIIMAGAGLVGCLGFFVADGSCISQEVQNPNKR